MATLLIPGRHLITTAFMSQYLEAILKNGLRGQTITGALPADTTINHIIIPITSANQQGSRYNPVPLHARIIGLERTLAPYREQYMVRVSYVPIPHFSHTPQFAELTLKYVEAHIGQTLTTSTTVVWCSTPALVAGYSTLGYPILPAEWDSATARYHTPPPNEILTALAEAGTRYITHPAYALLSAGTQTTWRDMPEIPEHIFRLWNDPLLTQDGSLTEGRDYATYAVGMSHSALMDVKFNDIKAAVIEGKIVDEGCADGALMVRLAEEFPDSDIIGIDITGEFISRVVERQRAGEFGQTFVYAYQRNLLQPIFAHNSITTTICNSTLHELWSYGNQETSLATYLEEKFRQLVPGGRLVIRDVVGPEDKEQIVYLKLRRDDGVYIPFDHIDAWKTADTATLSTESCFYRFVHDFLRELREAGRRLPDTQIQYQLVTLADEEYVRLRLKDAVEFLSRKDYHDNWDSEMNEEFAFFDIEEWQQALAQVGFLIIHDTAIPKKFSGAYANDWIVEQRWRPCVTYIV